jgi:4-hydroxybenzoate polyprenyltransferase
MIFPPLFRAIRSLAAREIRLAVKAGVMAVILMDAALAAGFADWRYGLLVLALFPVSRFLARQFAVT